MPEIYDLYVTSGVRGGAQAIGSGKPMIVIDSMLLARLGPGEQRVVLAHELGHIPLRPPSST
ncbi:MAG: M48 family metalloprotease [Actinomycetota bacterium]|nr:M48 family metalloprotease [Actinomycetota bacterium]